MEADVFNGCLHECADAAERTGDRCSFKFKDGDSSDLVKLKCWKFAKPLGCRFLA